MWRPLDELKLRILNLVSQKERNKIFVEKPKIRRKKNTEHFNCFSIQKHNSKSMSKNRLLGKTRFYVDAILSSTLNEHWAWRLKSHKVESIVTATKAKRMVNYICFDISQSLLSGPIDFLCAIRCFMASQSRQTKASRL